VVQDPRFMRPAEVDLLIGDPTRRSDGAGWEPEVGFGSWCAMMVDADLERPPRPVTPYAASKAAAELVVLQAAAGRVHAVVARSFNHTGPGQSTRFALASFARQLRDVAAGRAEPVLQVGNLMARRDFLDVRDVVRAYLTMMVGGESGCVYNVASGTAPALRELLDSLVALSGTGARVEVDAARVRPVDVPLLCGDATRLRALGWAPRIEMSETLADLLAAGEEGR
jgi:GDP-4-dehydro-6-deoxy-D-mannose reductase